MPCLYRPTVKGRGAKKTQIVTNRSITITRPGHVIFDEKRFMK